METNISSTEVARHLGEILARVKHGGESFIVTKSAKPLACLGPIRPPKGGTGAEIIGALSGLPGS